MEKNIADEFIGALTELESARNVERMVELFADNCEVGNIDSPDLFRGIEGVRRFWTDYRDNFKDVCSVFQKEFCSENKARLEWVTEGKTVSGSKIRYKVVSILETEDEKITRFYALFGTKNQDGKPAKRERGQGEPGRR